MNKKKFFSISVLLLGLVLAFISTACSDYSRSSLTGVVFGKVMIDGDQNDLAADVVREALYLRGATYRPDASPLVGRVEWHGLVESKADEVKLQIRIDNLHLAAVVVETRLGSASFYSNKTPIVVLTKIAAYKATEIMGEQNLARSSNK